MNIKEKIGWAGIIQISSNKKPTKIIRNRITDNALNEIIKALYLNPNLQLKYLAIGTDTSEVLDNATKLGNEIFRVPFVSWAAVGTGQIQSRAIILGTEPDYAPYNGAINIREIGFYCGASAVAWGGGAGKDTGTLLSRILVTENKEEDEEYQITRNDQITRF